MNKRTFTERYIPIGVTAWFHHLRDEDRVIFETTCDLIDDSTDKILVRGRAKVSPRDNPNKKIGRAISLGRALKEYYTGEGCLRL